MTRHPALAEDDQPSRWQHLHPLSPVLRGGFVFVVFAAILFANVQEWLWGALLSDESWRWDTIFEPSLAPPFDLDTLIERNLLLAAVGVVVAIIGLSLALAWLSWRFLTYRITAEVVETRSGVLFRKHRRAPLDRIQSVNVQRPLVARLLGLAKINIVTAGQSGNVDLAYLAFRDATVVRERILRQIQQQRSESPTHESQWDAQHTDAPEAPVHAAPGAVGDGLVSHLRDALDTDMHRLGEEPVTLVTVPTGRLIASVALNAGAAAVLAIALASSVLIPALGWSALVVNVIIVAITFGVVFSRVNRGFRFTLARTIDEIRIGSGLTATNTETIPLRRIHALEVRQPLLWRPFGWWMVRITIAGQSEVKQEQFSVRSIALPVGTEADAIQACDALVAGVAATDAQSEQVRDALTGAALDFQKAGPRSEWVLLFGKSRAGIATRTADTEPTSLESLWVRRGALTRSLSIMPITRIQSLELGRSLMHRLLGLASLQAHTVRGVVRLRMRGIALAQARAIFERLSAAVVRAQVVERFAGPSAGSSPARD